MKRLVVLLDYFGRSALRGLRSSPVTTAVAVVTIGVSLVLVGTFQLLLRNMQDLLDDFGEDLQVTAYLEDGLGAGEQRELRGVAAHGGRRRRPPRGVEGRGAGAFSQWRR